MLKSKLLSATAAAPEVIAIEDVFSTYLYTGNGSTQTITNGIDLAGDGGLIWTKSRTDTRSHYLIDSERPINRTLTTSTTDGQLASSGVTSFTSTGYTLDSNTYFNEGTLTYVSWTFRKAPRFFDVVTFSTTTGSSTPITVNHNLGATPGCIIVKQTNAAADWFVYHRSASANYYLSLNSTDFQQNGGTSKFYPAPDNTSFYLGGDFVQNGTYVAYLFAHDPLGPSGDGSDGLIACGSFSGNTTVSLGWEPQWILLKRSDSAGGWYLHDNMRGWPASGDARYLYANSPAAEGATSQIYPNATGFSTLIGAGNYIYIAIRRGPMREPTSGTEVFGVALGTGTYTHTTGFPVDLAIQATRASTIIHRPYDRLRGGGRYLETSSSADDQGGGTASFDNNTGYTNYAATLNAVDWMFRRAPGFFDVVAYTGDGVAGRTVSHNLGVAPELMIVKRREGSGNNWKSYVAPLGPTYALTLNETSQAELQGSTLWNSTAPSSEVFSVGTNSQSNASGGTYIAYLFATLPGVSKVGSYTGNGSSQTINCGFTGGARFVLIKRTDSTGDWYVWDTARGIVSGNDPHLSLNTTAAEVTSDDTIDPDSSGFIVNQVSATNVNVSSASYIFLAVS